MSYTATEVSVGMYVGVYGYEWEERMEGEEEETPSPGAII